MRNRAIYGVLFTAAALSAYALACTRRVDHWLTRHMGPTPSRGSCPLCKGPMALIDGGQRLAWYRCTSCAKAQVGLGPGQGLT